jgi:hypothetical protein
MHSTVQRCASAANYLRNPFGYSIKIGQVECRADMVRAISRGGQSLFERINATTGQD